MRRSTSLYALCLLLATMAAGAQSIATPASSNDSVFRRARKLVSEGNGAAGRALVDTLLRREQEGRPGYGAALYWRGALAETAADAERDYRRVIVEYPLSTYADDALLAMAELEQARGDRAGALQHLQRFVREHPVSTARGTAAFAGARLAFELGDTRAACTLIADARASVPGDEVELRNQIDYYAPRCSGSSAVAPTATSSPKAPITPARDSGRAASAARTRQPKVSVPMTPPPKIVSAATPVAPVTAPSAASTDAPTSLPSPAPSASSEKKPALLYTVQLAAYNTRAEANTLVDRLEKKGIHARVSGSTKPFRVRLALHATRRAAVDEVAALKAQSIIGFVTTEEQPSEQKRP